MHIYALRSRDLFNMPTEAELMSPHEWAELTSSQRHPAEGATVTIRGSEQVSSPIGKMGEDCRHNFTLKTQRPNTRSQSESKSSGTRGRRVLAAETESAFNFGAGAGNALKSFGAVGEGQLMTERLDLVPKLTVN